MTKDVICPINKKRPLAAFFCFTSQEKLHAVGNGEGILHVIIPAYQLLIGAKGGQLAVEYPEHR